MAEGDVEVQVHGGNIGRAVGVLRAYVTGLEVAGVSPRPRNIRSFWGFRRGAAPASLNPELVGNQVGMTLELPAHIVTRRFEMGP